MIVIKNYLVIMINLCVITSESCTYCDKYKEEFMKVHNDYNMPIYLLEVSTDYSILFDYLNTYKYERIY